MLPPVIFLLAFGTLINAQRPIDSRPRPEIPDPVSDVPTTFPSKPNPSNSRPDEGTRPGPAMRNAQIVEANLDSLETRLKNGRRATNMATDLASAILATTPSISWNPATAPTPTINITFFAPCTSYAQILTSCASATSSFFALEPTQQAECICYKPSSPSSSDNHNDNNNHKPSNSTNLNTGEGECNAQEEQVSTLDSSYDKVENLCWKFFKHYQYEGVAGLMDNTSELPGPQLCEFVRDRFSLEETITRTATGSTAGGSGCARTSEITPTPSDRDGPPFGRPDFVGGAGGIGDLGMGVVLLFTVVVTSGLAMFL